MVVESVIWRKRPNRRLRAVRESPRGRAEPSVQAPSAAPLTDDQMQMMSWVTAWATTCCSVATPNFC
jgi:hypothetical protein